MKNLSDIIISIVVIACSVVLLGALMVTVQDNPFSKPVFEFTIDFANAPGIKRNSQVTYAGQPVGKVEEVEILAPENRLEDHPGHIVRLHVDVTKEIPIPKNIKPTITAASMLGENIVTLNHVDDEGGLLGDGAVLVGFSAGPLDALAPGATDILDGVNEIVVRLNKILADFDPATIKEDIEAATANVREITDSVNLSLQGDNGLAPLLARLNEAADQLVILFAGDEGETKGVNPQFDEILENIRQITEEVNTQIKGDEGLLARLNSAATGIDVTINGPDGEPEKALRRQIQTIMEEIQVLLVYTQYFTGSIAEEPKKLLFGNNRNLDVPTKEAILQYIKDNGGNVPVRTVGKPGATPNPPGNSEEEIAKEREGLLKKIFKKR